MGSAVALKRNAHVLWRTWVDDRIESHKPRHGHKHFYSVWLKLFTVFKSCSAARFEQWI
jgi:hypothetical protein